MSGTVQILNEKYKDHEALTKALSTMKRAVDDGAQISSKMLKFTKTENGAEGYVAFDIRDLIVQSIDFTSPRWKNEAQAKGINYQIDMDGMKRVSAIMCNSSELREVFINIINNALDAMPDGGTLSFSTWSGDDAVFVSISDTGDGMSEETKKYIFDPFFTTKMAVGTGLGMSLAYGIITRHSGKIEVESEAGKGAKFTLQFPTTNEKASLITTHEPERELIEMNLRVLVVDDEDALCIVLDQFFPRYGNKVKTVNNGSDALNIVNAEDFDLVLFDLVMPDISGYDVIEVLNKLEKRPRIGIITGWGEKLKPMEEGMDVDFIVK
ncbi:MAG TPA: ATP-binding protein, partial [Candidatus Scalindua sp.]|nr:ATP-binding protein [Candidatus Scalindua sp.]